LREVSHPSVLGVYRLALAEAERSPEVAQSLYTHGRKANHAAVSDFLVAAQALGLVGPEDPAAMAAQFLALLWGDLLNQLLRRVPLLGRASKGDGLGRPSFEGRASARPPQDDGIWIVLTGTRSSFSRRGQHFRTNWRGYASAQSNQPACRRCARRFGHTSRL